MENIRLFRTQLKDIYQQVSRLYWEIAIEDKEYLDESLLFICKSQEKMDSALKNGYAGTILPNFSEIDEHVQSQAKGRGISPDQVDFILVIEDDERIWGVFNGREISW